MCYKVKDGDPGRVVLDKNFAHDTPLTGKAPGALMAAWDADLRAIIDEINSAHAKALATSDDIVLSWEPLLTEFSVLR